MYRQKRRGGRSSQHHELRQQNRQLALAPRHPANLCSGLDGHPPAAANAAPSPPPSNRTKSPIRSPPPSDSSGDDEQQTSGPFIMVDASEADRRDPDVLACDSDGGLWVRTDHCNRRPAAPTSLLAATCVPRPSTSRTREPNVPRGAEARALIGGTNPFPPTTPPHSPARLNPLTTGGARPFSFWACPGRTMGWVIRRRHAARTAGPPARVPRT